MKRRLHLFCTLLVILSITTSCKKKKARETLEGNWRIFGYNEPLSSQCEDEYESFTEFFQDLGEASFNDGVVSLSYFVEADLPWTQGCYNDAQIDLTGTYEVTDHIRQNVIFHEYEIEINGEQWFIEFYDSEDDELGRKANGDQNHFDLYMEKYPEWYRRLWLERI